MIEETLKSLPGLLSRGDWQGARQRATMALQSAPDHPDLNAFAAFIALRQKDHQAATDHARTAAKAGEQSPRAVAQSANMLAQLRLFDEALAAARALPLSSSTDPVVLDQAGAAFTACEAHREAEQAYARLVQIAPGNPNCRFNLAAAQRFTGNRAAAASNFDSVIAAQPGRGEAWYARALVTKATQSDNRIDDLQKILLSSGRLPDIETATIQYALGKELEDLGRYDEAFQAWSAGARVMRNHRPFQREDEIEAIHETIRLWPEARREPAASPLTPVFIVSLPRAGSTLIDRILSSHPAITSLGETEDFIVSLLQAPELANGGTSRAQAKRTAGIDLDAVGERYRTALHRRGHTSGVVIDKTPTNFLYAGLIAEALPEARIIHVTRNPLDATIATFKTLFRDRYFWSYDLADIASYIIAKTELTQHWCRNWPGRMTAIAYEDMVAETEAGAKRLISEIGQDWDPACLDFANSRTAVSTASADQVRQPVYTSSVGYWKQFETHLAPALKAFAAAGLD